MHGADSFPLRVVEPALTPIVPLGAAQNVSVLLVLLGFTRMDGYSKLLATFVNTGAVDATAYLDVSQDGVNSNPSKRVTLTVAAHTEENLELDGNLRRYFAMSADTIAAGGGLTTVKVEVMGLSRY